MACFHYDPFVSLCRLSQRLCQGLAVEPEVQCSVHEVNCFAEKRMWKMQKDTWIHVDDIKWKQRRWRGARSFGSIFLNAKARNQEMDVRKKGTFNVAQNLKHQTDLGSCSTGALWAEVELFA